ncbi:MAG: hypothetical protein K9K64_14640 [Desulfohalobiaceae bacterium]|nr:hypothetical protein [Desulfohalobiaceae bacterium]
MVKTQDYFRELVTIGFIQKRIIVLCVLIFTLGALLITLFWPRTFAAQGSILLKRNKPLKSAESLEDVNAEMTKVGEDDLFSEMEIITSKDVTVKALKSPLLQGYVSPEDAGSLEGRIQNNLQIQLVPKSSVIKVQLNWSDPGSAERILQALFDTYLDYRTELFNPKEATAFFRDQLQKYDQQLKELEKQLIEQSRASKAADFSQNIKSNLMVEDNLVRQLSELENDWRRRRNYIQSLEEMLNSSEMNFFTSVDNLDIGDMGKELQGLVMEKGELLNIYTPQSKKIQRVNQQIQETYSSLKAEVKRYIQTKKAELRGVEQSVQEMKDQLQRLSNRNVELYENEIQANRIQREIDVLESSYMTFAKRWQEAKINSTTKADKLFTVSVLSRPSVSQAAVFPKPKREIPLGLILGLLVGVTVGFLVEFFDHTFKRPEDLQNYSNIPVVYSIPKF